MKLEAAGTLKSLYHKLKGYLGKAVDPLKASVYKLFDCLENKQYWGALWCFALIALQLVAMWLLGPWLAAKAVLCLGTAPLISMLLTGVIRTTVVWVFGWTAATVIRLTLS
ncbi:hypothetical protein [Klebsiella variicola]|uniref:hypothetical protein n=1 Tax=Klebsiella variicola TaxID=244366 RepID=UPI002B05EF13|nr:hypothetical protein [Klebsiella variicola]